MIKTLIGLWCLTHSVSNGAAPLTYERLPRTNIYERKADCPVENRITIGPHSLDGHGALIVEGQPKGN